MKQTEANPGRPGGRRIRRSLIALSSAAVVAVYSAGYVRTRAAAIQRFAVERRTATESVSKPAAEAAPRAATPAPRAEVTISSKQAEAGTPAPRTAAPAPAPTKSTPRTARQRAQSAPPSVPVKAAEPAAASPSESAVA